MTTMSDAETGHAEADDPLAEIPTWDDEYIESVSERLMHNYDLKKEYTVESEQFTLYGRMELHSQKHFLHPSLSFAHHASYEHLFLRRENSVRTTDVERLVELGHSLSDTWIDPDEEHYSTEFTFVLVVPEISADVRSRVADLDERTLLKYGYNGHYEINCIVVAPEKRDLVANDAADVGEAFRTWDPIERSDPGLLGLIARRLQL